MPHRPHRRASRELRLRLDNEIHDQLRTHARARHEAMAVVVRRAVAWYLHLQAADQASQIIAEEVRLVVREELRSVRRLAYLGAFESAHTARKQDDFQWQLLTALYGRAIPDAEGRKRQIASAIDGAERRAQAWAHERLQDPEPVDPREVAPAAPLPPVDHTSEGPIDTG